MGKARQASMIALYCACSNMYHVELELRLTRELQSVSRERKMMVSDGCWLG